MTKKAVKKIIHDEDEIFRIIDRAYGNILYSIAWDIFKNRHDV